MANGVKTTMWNPFSRAYDERSRYRIHVDDFQAWYHLGEYLRQQIRLLSQTVKGTSEILLLCIGTDRSTGDCLGPLTGSLLSETPGIGVMIKGTLNEPVHATNLREAIADIEALEGNPLVIAVDACLGRSENVGYINVNHGPLKPGTGVNKVLPEVGDMHITGIVNLGGYMEYLVLQNTRLSLVMKMATSIAKAIQHAVGYRNPITQPDDEIVNNTDPILAERESAVAKVIGTRAGRPR